MDVGMIRHYAAEGMTRGDIANLMGMSYSRITTVIRENGIKIQRKKHECKKRGPREQTIKIIELRRQGITQKQIAKKLGCCLDTVKYACKNYGLSKENKTTTIDEAIEIIGKAGYDYVSGFVNSHSKVTVRCRACGGEFDRMYKNLREKAIGTYKNEMMCPYCWRTGVERNRQKKREPKERDAQMRAQRKAEQLSRKVNDQLTRRLAIHVCKNCGQEFCMATTGYDSEIYCSKKCQARWHNRIKNDKRVKRMVSGDHDTDITLDKLFKRDGGVCYICGISCDWTDIAEKDGAMIAGDKYPSIDHVKPLSKGGTHTWDNLKLACRRCNTAKGWKV